MSAGAAVASGLGGLVIGGAMGALLSSTKDGAGFALSSRQREQTKGAALAIKLMFDDNDKGLEDDKVWKALLGAVDGVKEQRPPFDVKIIDDTVFVTGSPLVATVAWTVLHDLEALGISLAESQLNTAIRFPK